MKSQETIHHQHEETLPLETAWHLGQAALEQGVEVKVIANPGEKFVPATDITRFENGRVRMVPPASNREQTVSQGDMRVRISGTFPRDEGTEQLYNRAEQLEKENNS